MVSEIVGALVVLPSRIGQLSVSNLLLERSGSVLCRIGSALKRLLDGRVRVKADALGAAAAVSATAVLQRVVLEPFSRFDDGDNALCVDA